MHAPRCDWTHGFILGPNVVLGPEGFAWGPRCVGARRFGVGPAWLAPDSTDDDRAAHECRARTAVQLCDSLRLCWHMCRLKILPMSMRELRAQALRHRRQGAARTQDHVTVGGAGHSVVPRHMCRPRPMCAAPFVGLPCSTNASQHNHNHRPHHHPYPVQASVADIERTGMCAEVLDKWCGSRGQAKSGRSVMSRARGTMQSSSSTSSPHGVRSGCRQDGTGRDLRRRRVTARLSAVRSATK